MRETNTILNEASFLRSMYGLASLVFFSLRVFTNRSSSMIRSSCSFQCLLYIYQVSPFLGFKTFYEYTTSQNTHYFLFRSKNTSRSADICFVGLQWQGVLVVKSFFLGGGQVGRKDRDLGSREPGDLSERP